MSSTGSTDSTGLSFSQRDSMENVSPRSPSSATFSSQHTKENVLQTLSNDMASVQNQLRAMEYTEVRHKRSSKITFARLISPVAAQF